MVAWMKPSHFPSRLTEERVLELVRFFLDPQVEGKSWGYKLERPVKDVRRPFLWRVCVRLVGLNGGTIDGGESEVLVSDTTGEVRYFNPDVLF
ncbi:MAG TPA: hypothetical protein VGE52_00635 [Pirellulales bacterium]